jgi:hypothetical protein
MFWWYWASSFCLDTSTIQKLRVYSSKFSQFAKADTRLSRGVAQPGSALAWGARGRVFESLRPDHLFLSNIRQLSRLSKPAFLCLRKIGAKLPPCRLPFCFDDEGPWRGRKPLALTPRCLIAWRDPPSHAIAPVPSPLRRASEETR